MSLPISGHMQVSRDSAQRGFWGGHLKNRSHHDYGPDTPRPPQPNWPSTIARSRMFSLGLRDKGLISHMRYDKEME